MHARPEPSPGTNYVVLPESCTLKEAAGVKTLLLDGLEVPGNVELDARLVERIDTSVLQLVAAFTHDLREAGRAVTWVGASADLQRSASQLGLARDLGLGLSLGGTS
jgi:anti-anti-sigma regulatory factor